MYEQTSKFGKISYLIMSLIPSTASNKFNMFCSSTSIVFLNELVGFLIKFPS